MTREPGARAGEAGGGLPLGTYLLLGALAAFPPVTIDTYLPALPALTRDLGASPAAGQLTLGACMLGLGLGQLVLGPLSDAFGRRRPLLVALVPFCLASLACAAAPSIALLVALRFVQGVCAAVGLLTAQAVVRDRTEGHAMARTLSSLVLVSGLAPILAPLVGAQVLRLGGSWRAVFVLLAALVALLFAVVALRFEDSLPLERRRRASPRAVASGFVGLARDRRFVAHAATGGAAAGALFTYIAGSPFVLQDLRGLGPASFALAFAANAVAMVVVSQVGARVVQRTGPRRLVQVGLGFMVAGSASCTAALLVGAPTSFVVAPLGLQLAGVGLVFPNNVALALRPYAGAAATAAACLGLAQYASGGASTPLFGLAAAAVGRAAAWPWGALMTAWAVLAAVAFAFTAPGEGPAARQPTVGEGASTGLGGRA